MTISREKLNSIFKGLAGKRILVIGDVMLDRYIRGEVSRISPEAPVPIVEMESEQYHFGGAANVALNLKALGCEPLTLGLLGTDNNADAFFDILQKEGLDKSGLLRTADRPTTVKTRIIGDNQHMVRVDREKIIYDNKEVEDALKSQFNALVQEADAVILEDYNKGVLTKSFINHILEYTHQHQLFVSVDPKFINFSDFKNCTVFKPNIKETAQALALPLNTESQIENAGLELIEKLKAKNVLLTRGAQGISLFESDGQSTHIPAKTRKVADVSGAGDTVIATLTAAMIAGGTVKEAALISNYAAGVVCGEVGIVPISAKTLREEIEQDLY